jgi:hypothetical protein
MYPRYSAIAQYDDTSSLSYPWFTGLTIHVVFSHNAITAIMELFTVITQFNK